MKDEHMFIVAYDISDPKRWRKVFKLMKGYGEWLQFSVFQCRCSTRRYTELMHRLDRLIHHLDDQVLLIDIGDAENVRPKIASLGKPYQAVERKAVVV